MNKIIDETTQEKLVFHPIYHLQIYFEENDTRKNILSKGTNFVKKAFNKLGISNFVKYGYRHGYVPLLYVGNKFSNAIKSHAMKKYIEKLRYDIVGQPETI